MRNDINLIPKRNSIISAKMMFMVLVISMSGLILMGYFGLFLPLNEKRELKSTIKENEEELLLYSNVDATYAATLEQVENLVGLKTVFEALKNDNLKMTQTIKDLQENIPKNIIVNKIDYKDGELLMEGLSPTNKEIAQYIVKLRQLDYVLKVDFTSAEVDVSLDNGTDTGNKKEDMMYLFKITVSLKTYNVPVVDQSLQEGDTTEEKGGE